MSKQSKNSNTLDSKDTNSNVSYERLVEDKKDIKRIKPPSNISCFKNFCNKNSATETKRTIEINTSIYKSPNNMNYRNVIKNQKYNWLTLIPLVLLHQFSFFSNQFYLGLAITQMFDVLKVGLLFSYVSPFVFVLTVTLVKEFIDEIYRYKRDQELNNEQYEILICEQIHKIKSKDIRIGDIIIIHKDQRIPADMLLLKSFEQNESCFIKTDQLDGETDWKLRKAPSSSQKLKEHYISQMNCFIDVEPPRKEIYEFQGLFKLHNGEKRNSKFSAKYQAEEQNINQESAIDNEKSAIEEPLNLENTLWANTVLASSRCIGIVLYTGKETRSQMNCTESKEKVGVLDHEINFLSKLLFFKMIIFSLFMIVLKGIAYDIVQNLIAMMRFLVLFSSIIPISLKVNLDISKTINSIFISKSKYIPETICRNSTLPEELGRIEYIFTDKTGTLTKNEMIFRKLYMENELFENEKLHDIKGILEKECSISNAPMLDIIEYNNKQLLSSVSKSDLKLKKLINRNYLRNRNQNKVLRDSITAMVLCNCVTPVIEIVESENPPQDSINDNSSCSELPKENKKITFQASSPDEIALVEFAMSMNMKLTNRTSKLIEITNCYNFIEKYEILAEFPFSSDTKRMGIILKNLTHGHIIFYLKGAENIIEQFVKEDKKSYVKDNAEQLAINGLRTLVLTQKLLTESFYNDWNEKYQQAKKSMSNRKENIEAVIGLLEKDMEFLCVTGVEDLLQDSVNDTIESLRKAYIRIWMLTGDKVETAKCIAISTGLKSKEQREFIITNDKDPASIIEKLQAFKLIANVNWVFIIDGDCLNIALNECEEIFFRSAMKAYTVVCCRCSPTQKAQIVRNIKKYTTKRTLAIGDGGNDVAMILEANLGVGVVGKEGMQASLAADYSIIKFCHLKSLLLWFGRISYKNTSNIALFVIHRGLIISLLQMFFSIIFYYNSIPLYNGWLILGYTTLYTSFPAVSLILDREIKPENAFKFPDIYKELQKGRALNMKAYLYLTLQSFFQAAVIMFGSIYLFKSDIFLNIVTITFSSLIVAELLNVYLEINTFHWFMLVSLFGTFILYFSTIIIFRNILNVAFILEDYAWVYVFALTLISWLPFYLFKKIKKCIYPDQLQQIQLANNDMEKLKETEGIELSTKLLF